MWRVSDGGNATSAGFAVRMEVGDSRSQSFLLSSWFATGWGGSVNSAVAVKASEGRVLRRRLRLWEVGAFPDPPSSALLRLLILGF